MTITPLYAALLAFVFIVLSIRVIRIRRRLRVAMGDAGNEELQRMIGVHSNFAEYTPLTLVLILLLELQGAPGVMIHSLGIGLLVGRLAHAFGVSQTPENYRFRAFGMVMTFAVLFIASLSLLFFFVKHLVD